MELNNGFKQTEVGVIPEDWEVISIGETLKIRHGKSQKEVQSENGIYPILGTGGLMGYANHFLYNKESVLIGRKGTIDKPKYMNTPFWSVDTLFYSEINDDCSAKYLYYNFLMIDWYRYNEASGVPSLNAKTIEKICIPIPPTLPEQTAIATALSDMDALLAQTQKIIEKKKAIKQGLMQELLRPKVGWEVRKLGEVIDKIVGGGTPSRSNPFFWGKEIPWVTVKDFATFNPYFTQEYITKEGLKNSASNLIPKGILITSTRMGLGKAVIYEVDVSINQDLKALFPKPNLLTKYLYFWFQKNAAMISDMGSGSTVMGISLNELKNIKFSLPSIEEQTRIAQILTEADQEIQALESKLTKLQAQKQGMMQVLLTGKIRLLP